MASKSRKPLFCVDLFAGAGGFSLAAKQAGLTISLAVENNPHACNTYKQNFCSDLSKFPMLIEGDIRPISPVEIAAQNIAKGGGCDVMLGGPPCQGFSTHRINDSGVNDPRNSLIHTYFEFVKAFQPAVFLMENVPGMLWARHASYLDEFYEAGRKTKYKILDPVVIDARDYGLPQRRKRVFVLGVREDIDCSTFTWPPEPTHADPSKCDGSNSLRKWVNCEAIFQPAALTDPNNVHMNHTEELVDVFKRTPANGGSRKDSGRVLKCHENHNGHKDVYGRIDPRVPAPTMTTACINPSKGRFVHPTEHHGITLRQAARIQTFPDNFVFSGGLIASGQQIGNAVPIQLGKILIEHVKPLAEQAACMLAERIKA
jgi:DNA (cytosine-5)-methyltransferase 1